MIIYVKFLFEKTTLVRLTSSISPTKIAKLP